MKDTFRRETCENWNYKSRCLLRTERNGQSYKIPIWTIDSAYERAALALALLQTIYGDLTGGKAPLRLPEETFCDVQDALAAFCDAEVIGSAEAVLKSSAHEEF